MSGAVERLRKLDAEATPGPWWTSDNQRSGGWTNGVRAGPGSSGLVCPVARGEDGELIAESRNALPDLLDVAEAMEYELGERGVEAMCSGSHTEYGCAGCPAHNAERALRSLARLSGDREGADR